MNERQKMNLKSTIAGYGSRIGVRMEQTFPACPSERAFKFTKKHLAEFHDTKNLDFWPNAWFAERVHMWDYETKIIGL